jgi:hypothetical protein
MPGEFYIEGKQEKVNISAIVTAVAELEAKLDSPVFGLAALKALINAMNGAIFETPVEATITMDGTEKVLVEKTDGVVALLEGYVDLSNMAGGDTIIIRQYMKIKTGGDYVKYAEETYIGAQAIPLVHISAKPANIAIKVTAEQTAGVNRSLDCQFGRLREP